MPKIVAIDSSSLSFRAIFNYEKMLMCGRSGQFILKPDYTYFSMLISCLKKIGLDKDDLVIIAQDAHSWRKDYDANYKAQREGQRAEHRMIDWPKEFDRINKINEKISRSTPFHLLRIPHAEADDILATCPIFFKDQEIVLVTGDKDIYQLAYYPNVKIFTYNVKIDGSRGGYIAIDDPLKIIEDKVRLGDKSDNILVDKENDTEQDRELRRFIVDLIHLPKFVADSIIVEFQNLLKDKVITSDLPFPDSLGLRWPQIYNKSGMITFESCVEKAERKHQRKLAKDRKKRLLKKETLKHDDEEDAENMAKSLGLPEQGTKTEWKKQHPKRKKKDGNLPASERIAS